MSIIIIALLVSLVIQLIFFIPAYIYKTDKLTDLSYGLTFLLLSIIFFSYSFGKLMLYIMIAFWSARLVSYLALRIWKMKKDKRFDGIRENFLKFAGFWLLQGVTVWIVMIPSFYYFISPVDDFLILGFAIWLIGFFIETIADYQKFDFRNDKKNKGNFISSGLWKYSRHPNYFGEILCWFGVFLFVLPGIGYVERFISIISPVFITALLLFISGIPTVEKSSDQKYGKDKAYKKYKRETSILIPWFKIRA